MSTSQVKYSHRSFNVVFVVYCVASSWERLGDFKSNQEVVLIKAFSHFYLFETIVNLKFFSNHGLSTHATELLFF